MFFQQPPLPNPASHIRHNVAPKYCCCLTVTLYLSYSVQYSVVALMGRYFESQVVCMIGNVRDLWSFVRREKGAIRQCLLEIGSAVTPTQSCNTIIISLLIPTLLCKETSSVLKYVGHKYRTRLARSQPSVSQQPANVNTNLKLSENFRPSEWNLILCAEGQAVFFTPLPPSPTILKEFFPTFLLWRNS